MTTSFSFVSYTGNGTTQTFNVPFQYISKSHVEVYEDDFLRTAGISWDNDSTIRLNPAPPSGSIVRLERNTPKTTALVDFQDAGVLTETALDLNTRQGLFIVQEAFDEASNVVSQAVAAAVAASQVAGRSVPTVPTSAIGRFLVGRSSNSYGWANNLTFDETTGVLTANSFVGNVTGNVTGTAANVTGTVAITNGGTGANSQSAARTALGLGSAATLNSTATGSALVGATNSAEAADVASAAPVNITSAATTDIGAATSPNVRVTGTTPITSFGTAAAGVRRYLTFAGILTITYNATSLQTPGLANITTAAGDTAVARSLGSGNWVIESYTRASALPVLQGSVTSSGLTMATARLLGRTDAGTGAPQEISIGGGLTLTGGVLSGPASPNQSGALGQWQSLFAGAGVNLVLPPGGTWGWVVDQITPTQSITAGVSNDKTAGVSAGGTTIAVGSGSNIHRGFCWRFA